MPETRPVLGAMWAPSQAAMRLPRRPLAAIVVPDQRLEPKTGYLGMRIVGLWELLLYSHRW